MSGGGLQINADVKLEEHGTWELYGLAAGGTKCGVSLGTNGTGVVFCGGSTSPVAVPTFAVGVFHAVSLKLGAGGSTELQVLLNGKILGSASGKVVDGMTITMALDRYINASVDNFKITRA